MFERFGEFNSAEEINEKARRLREQNAKDSLIMLAKENGIDVDIVEAFVDGDIQYLCDNMAAAIGKIDVESAYLGINGILKDWEEQIKAECIDDDNMAKAIRKKGKSLQQCMANLIRFSFENKVKVSDEIVKITKVMHNKKEEPLRGPLYLGVPNKMEVKQIVRKYYLG